MGTPKGNNNKKLETTLTSSPSLRKTDQSKPKVMFTGVTDEQSEKVITAVRIHNIYQYMYFSPQIKINIFFIILEMKIYTLMILVLVLCLKLWLLVIVPAVMFVALKII